MKDLIMVIDDIEINRTILREILQHDYDIIEAENGEQALCTLLSATRLPCVILLDVIMPQMNGFEVLEALRASPYTRRIPVLFITIINATFNETWGLRCGAADYITKPFHPDIVKARVDNQVRLTHYRDYLEQMVVEKTRELVQVHERVMETLATIIEYRSDESGAHVRRCVELMRSLVGALLSHPKLGKELENMEYDAIIKAIALHDIGKVGIPDSILLKPGRLTDEEFAVIKTHTTIGSTIVQSISLHIEGDHAFLRHAQDICRSHHESWDGTGYPDGLAGEDIPLSARMASVVDVYDALVNPRCYKSAVSHREAMDILVAGRGIRFDLDIIDAVIGVQQDFNAIEQSMGLAG